MKIIKEEIEIDKGRSFKVFSPRLKNYFYWHYHPEIELVFVEAINGIRHVGKNISGFVESDLVLIGSNVPHLNFDYGIETDYHQIVVQFNDRFIENNINSVPEFQSIRKLLDDSYLGISFHGETKTRVVKKLKEIHQVNVFSSLLDLMDILQTLAVSTEFEKLNSDDTRIKFFLNDKIRMGTIYDYIHENFDKKPDVNEISDIVHLSTSAFCRYFKKQTDITFTDFVNRYRINQAKTYLLQEASISEVCYRVGYESISYFNKLFKQLVGETPSAFKQRYSTKSKE
ncbi:AraC family transcriptional regulator [Sphingobacterium sp. SG20118]|uniref:AraC family transcriptional regulator n=1 Tax=Sphingobacterium sp. SG20118 TaxID=3367156 RepID=UPI0037DFC060